MKKLWLVFGIVLVILLSSCGITKGKVRIENDCPWSISVTASCDGFSQTESIKSDYGVHFNLEYNTEYTIEVRDGISTGSVWTFQKTTPWIPTTWHISWKDLTYHIK